MAVKETPARYKGFTFDGVDSKDYGVYIQDGGMFDAPARDVEMVEIPGRNGAYALDKGRFENVTLTYQAFIPQDSETDFAPAIRDFRNQLASRKGYCRLEDEFNTDEYRLAVFKDGLTIDNVSPKVGTFDIVFDCKPQRYLTSGETKRTITSGYTYPNPTFFSCNPLWEVEGYGSIQIGEQTVTIENGTVGNVVLANAESLNSFTVASAGGDADLFPAEYGMVSVPFDSSALNTNDTITVGPIEISLLFGKLGGESVTRASITNFEPNYPDSSQVDIGITAKATKKGLYVSIPKVEYPLIGGTGVHFCQACRASVDIDYSNQSYTGSVCFGLVCYSNRIEIYVETTASRGFPGRTTVETSSITGNSTVSVMGHPVYIDSELGIAYKIEDGTYISLDNFVSFGKNPPVLLPGGNEITFDSTIADLKMTPRWWQV